jgi:hypothetical protein
LVGISEYSASLGSCTTVRPPASCTARSPSDPSLKRPDKMTPMTCSL